MGDIYTVPSIPAALEFDTASQETMAYSIVCRAELEVDAGISDVLAYVVKIPAALELDQEAKIGYQSNIFLPASLDLDASVKASVGITVVARAELECDAGVVTSVNASVVSPASLEVDADADSIVVAIHCAVVAALACDAGVSCGKGYIIVAPAAMEVDAGEQVAIGYSVLVPAELEADSSNSVVTKSFVVLPAALEVDAGVLIGSTSSVEIAAALGVSASDKIVDNLTAILMLALYGQSVQPTLFSNFPFNSFFQDDDGKTYASGPGGIYLVGSAGDDDGDSIIPSVTVDFHKLGTNKQKQLVSIYADDGSKCAVDLDDIIQNYEATSKGRFDCRYDHIGKEMKLTFSEFESLSAVEIFLYHLARLG